MNNYITIDGKEYVITTKYKDKKYGEVIKAVSRNLRNFERIYLIKNKTNYERVMDFEILEYFARTYETSKDDIVK